MQGAQALRTRLARCGWVGEHASMRAARTTGAHVDEPVGREAHALLAHLLGLRRRVLRLAHLRAPTEAGALANGCLPMFPAGHMRGLPGAARAPARPPHTRASPPPADCAVG